MKTIKYLLSIVLVIAGGITVSAALNNSQPLRVQAASTATPPPAKISEVFPDPNFAAVIAEELQISTDDQVTQDELNEITLINASGKGIENISGIEYLSGLASVWLDDNAISDLSPLAGANLPILQLVVLSDNAISDLTPFATLDAPILQRLMLENNQIADIMPLTAGDFSVLMYLYVSNNHIGDLSPLAEASFYDYLENGSFGPQTITLPAIPWQADTTILNPVLALDGTPVIPTQISDGGTYSAPEITWNNLSESTIEVKYDFNQTIEFPGLFGDGVFFDFYGTVTQPLQTAVEHTVTFSVDGAVYGRSEVLSGAHIAEPAPPVKAGYTFSGWNTVADGSGVLWDFINDTMPDEDMTLYAQWQETTASNTGTLPETGELHAELIISGLVLFSVAGIVLFKKFH